jgi:hypothetical protein
MRSKLLGAFSISAICVTLAACPPNALLSDVEVKVNVYQASLNQAQITAFSFAGFANNPGVINQSAGTIAVTVPYGTSVTALVAAFTTPASNVQVGSVSQVSGQTANDFTSPVVYTTIGQSGSTKTYTVTVTLAAPLPGDTWTARTMPNGVWIVAYGSGVFLAVDEGGTGGSSVAYTSNDGITWNLQALSTSAQWSALTSGNNVFVAVGGAATVASADGVNWNTGTIPTGGYTSVTYGNGKFVAVSLAASKAAATSTDGLSWTAQSLPSGAWQSVTYGNGKFVAVAGGASSNLAATSPDGVNWTLQTLPAMANWTSVTYGNNSFVAVAWNGGVPPGSNVAATSPDGINWTAQTMPATANWDSLTYCGSRFVAVSYGSSTSANSADGNIWVARTLPSSASWRSVAFGNGKVVAVTSGTVAATSP